MRFDKRPSRKAKSGYTWRVTLDYTDQYGKPCRYSKSGFATKKEAQAHGLETEKKLTAGIDLSARQLTLDDVFDQWRSVTTFRKSTTDCYSSHYRNWVSPILGSMPIERIRYPQLQALFSDLSNLGTGTLTGIRKVLSALGKLAVKSGCIESWPIDLVEISGQDKSRKREEYISLEDFNRLVDAVLDNRIPFHGGYQVMTMYLGYFAGLRISECCGLLWSDIDFDKRLLTVSHQLSTSGMITSVLKTDASYGSIPLPEPLYNALKQWREANPYDRVICTREGETVWPSSVRTQVRAKAEKIGIDYHPHMLRHTFVTNLLNAGADIKTTSRLARHKDVSVTLQVYAEVVGDKKAEAMRMAFGSDEDAPKILA